MRQDKWIKKIRKLIFVIIFFIIELQYEHTAYAANLRFYNYNTESNVNYSGKQASYIFNNRELSLPTPGILINGTALADYEDLFVKELGLHATLQNDTITLTDGKNVLILTLGSKKVKVNSEFQTMSVAPVKLKFDDNTIKYYVPTRFVSEAFGFNYVWNSATSTVKITKTFQMQVNDKIVLYNNTVYTAAYENENISCTMPIIYYNDHILAPAKDIFYTIGCTYEEKEDIIRITKQNIEVILDVTSNKAIVNNITYNLSTAPVILTDTMTKHTQVYVPLECMANLLGFEFTYNDPQRKYTLYDTEYTGKPELHPELKVLLQAAEVAEAKAKAEAKELAKRNYYFDWQSQTTNIPDNSLAKYISRVTAYEWEDTVVLEIYGITRNDINDFIDNQMLVFELENVISNMNTQFFVDFTVPHLNYVFMKTINNNTKFLFMIPIEYTWNFVETNDGIQVYFMKEDLSLEDLNIASQNQKEVTPKKTQVVYPDNKLVIPLPKLSDDLAITVNDNYLDKNFQILISGNHTLFWEYNTILNPYDFVYDIAVEYDSKINSTVITCKTDFICGFNFAKENGYIALNVGKPNEIFDKIIVLDAGHGGKDPGAAHNNVLEKDLNFSILYTYSKTLFEQSDIKVYYTRETDVFITLNNRAKFSREVGADLFISLHMNASDYESAHGTEVFYSKSNNKKQASGLNSYRLADTLANNLSNSLGSRLRGVTKSDYYVVEHNSVPAVLIELGFITNKEECSNLASVAYQKKAAEAIYQSVIEIFTAYPTGR